MTILHNASKVMAISQYNKDKLLELGVSSDKIITIMPKIDFDKFRNFLDIGTLIEKYHLNDKKIILSVNRLVERKGNDMVIKAFLKIKNKVSHAVYVIVGSGEYEEDLKKLVEQYHLSNDVLFISSVSDEDVLRFYNLCDVFVMLSREIKEKGDAEGFGIVFLEANACGKPVVGGDSGGMRDAVIDGETGILVNPCNTDQISEAIIKLLEDEEYAKKLGENGRARVENQFDWRVGQEELKELNF